MNIYYFCCGNAHRTCYDEQLLAVLGAVSTLRGRALAVLWSFNCVGKVNNQTWLFFCRKKDRSFLLSAPQTHQLYFSCL